MKKTIVFLALLSLMILPAAALPATEVNTTYKAPGLTLGGYVKLEADWDSTQMNKNMTYPVMRNNDSNFHHGRLKFTANSTRLNLTIKGPKLWGAQITGFVEADFDANGGSLTVGADTLTTGAFRLRHAMFRLNWPETELMLGQYWGYFSEYTPETAQDSGCQFVGSPTQRLPQIRLTQKFLGAWTVSALVGAAYNPGASGDANYNNNPDQAGSTEGPQIQGKIAYEKDHWGKAAFYGVPRPFAIQLAAGWQRSRYRTTGIAAGSAWHNGYNAPLATGFVLNQRDQQYLNPWIAMASTFIPVIPTQSANLAGTASISTQWYIGQGLEAFGEAITGAPLGGAGFTANIVSSYLMWSGVGQNYDRELISRYGGFIQGQYYFNNEWFLNANWGMSKAFGLPYSERDTSQLIINPTSNGYTMATQGDIYKFWQQYSLTLWYRPITALKFGVQYSYARTDWLQKVTTASKISDVGENHRVMFAGFYYF